MMQSILSIGAAIPNIEKDWQNNVPTPLRRRSPQIWQLCHLAVERALSNSERKPTAIVCATALGALNEAAKFLHNLAKNGYGSPRQFISSVNNSMVGKLAEDFDISGANLTLCDSYTSLASAIVAATLLRDETVLLVAAEEYFSFTTNIGDETGKHISDTVPQEGAIALLLSKDIIEGKAKISATSPQRTNSSEFVNEGFFMPAYRLIEAIKAEDDIVIDTFSPSAKATIHVSF